MILSSFIIIDGIFKNLDAQVKKYEDILLTRLVQRDACYGDLLLPKYFYVAPEYLDAERADPG